MVNNSTKMSKSNFHHYVPRFYLARFVDSNDRLWVFDKITDRVFKTTPNKIAGENRFYDVDDLRTIGADPQLLEKQLADIESEVYEITENWLYLLETKGAVKIPQINREIISLFLALQLWRTAEARIILVQFAKELQTVREFKKGYDPEKDARGLHTQFLWDEEAVDMVTKKIADCIWIFAKNDSGQSFYTSDNPALVKSFDNKQWLFGSDVFERGMYIVYPLSTKWILYCKDRQPWSKLTKFDGLVSPIGFTIDMVNHENSGQVGRSTRFVFSNSPDFGFAKGYLGDYPVHSDPDRKRFGQSQHEYDLPLEN